MRITLLGCVLALGVLLIGYFFGKIGMTVVIIGVPLLILLVALRRPIVVMVRSLLRGERVNMIWRGDDGVLRGKCVTCRSPVIYVKDESGLESFTCSQCGEAGTILPDSTPPNADPGDAESL